MANQNHIHLSDTIGSAPENAPNLQWHVYFPNYADTDVIFMTVRRTGTAKLKRHVLTSGGNIVHLNNFKLTLRVDADYGYTIDQRKAQLKALQGKAAYFVPIGHAADGANHTSDRKSVVVSRVGDFIPYDQLLQRFYVDVELEDNSL